MGLEHPGDVLDRLEPGPDRPGVPAVEQLPGPRGGEIGPESGEHLDDGPRACGVQVAVALRLELDPHAAFFMCATMWTFVEHDLRRPLIAVVDLMPPVGSPTSGSGAPPPPTMPITSMMATMFASLVPPATRSDRGSGGRQPSDHVVGEDYFIREAPQVLCCHVQAACSG